MYPGYLNLGCHEVINTERVAAYAAAHGLSLECDRCPDLPEILGDGPYTSPAVDDAPWYDPVRIASADFLGVAGQDAIGATGATFTRDPVPLIGGGSAIGPLRREHREIEYTVMLAALSECGLVYGMEWLSRVLAADGCGAACSGAEAFLWACCPDAGAGEYDQEARHLYDVGILEGPTLTSRAWDGDILTATVTFTLVAGNPRVYGEPITGTPGDFTLLANGAVERADPDQVYQRCITPTPCAADPLCPKPLLPPAPPEPLSPCYAEGVGDFLVTRLHVSAVEYPAWSELVPVVEVLAGGKALRRVLVRFWANPTEGPCDPDVLDPCDACGDINVSYIPIDGALTVDGRTGRAQIACETEYIGTALSAPDLYGREGGAFSYPVFPCPGGLCVEVWALESSVAPDAQVRVQLIPRADVM